MRCLARSRSSRPSGCLRQATRPAPAGTCSAIRPWFFHSQAPSPLQFLPPLSAPASLREIPFSPIRGDLRHSRALSALRVSLCTAEDCHNHNKFSPCLRASVRAPSNFLPFAGPKPQKNLTPAIEQIPPTTVGGTPTLLEPPSAPLRVASLLRYAPVAPPGLHICLSLWTCAIARVFASFAGTYFPSGAALRAVCAASRRSNFVLIPHTWRRGWDSNPRDLAVLRFSRPAH